MCAYYALCLQVLATLGLPVTARDVAGLMSRFATTGRGEGDSSFLYPRLLENVAGGRGRAKSGDLLRFTRTEKDTSQEHTYW